MQVETMAPVRCFRANRRRQPHESPSKPVSLRLRAWFLLAPLALFPCGDAQAETRILAAGITLPAEGLEEFKTDPWAEESQGNQISGVVRCLLEDRQRNVWFGTQDGLARYDGTSLVYYDLRNQAGAGMTVRSLAEDHDGRIWVGMDGGLARYDGEYFTSFSQDDGLLSTDVWSLFVDRTGDLWISTIDGVCRFDGEAFAPFAVPAATEKDHRRGIWSPNMVWSFSEDSEGQLWLAAASGVYRYDGHSLARVPGTDQLSNGQVNSVLEDRHGNLWFTTQYQGLFRFDGEAFIDITEQEGLEGMETAALIEDRQGNIWFSAEHHGVYRYDGDSYTNFSQGSGLDSHAVHSIMEDERGRLWTCGWLGVYRYDGTSFVNVTRDGPW